MAIPSQHRPRLCVIPCGNGDDFARTLSLPRNPTKALQLLSSHTLTPKRIDLGKASNHWFAETLSFGLDAAIALGTQELRKKTNRTGNEPLCSMWLGDQLKNHRDIHKVHITFRRSPYKNRLVLSLSNTKWTKLWWRLQSVSAGADQ